MRHSRISISATLPYFIASGPTFEFDLLTSKLLHDVNDLSFQIDSIILLLSVLSPVRLSVCLSDGWITEERLKLGLWNFHHTVAPTLQFLRGKFHPEIVRGSPREKASNKGVVGKISSFLYLSVNISKTVANTTKVTIND